jgi:2-C-methyl-D-erythritol 2,4-cyclodiphosphate synthase
MTAPNIRIGLGHDTHRLEAGRPLILGGVSIEFQLGLAGHSDADVLLHAITDAILGALALGDIGEWFPNTDPEWHGAASDIFLKRSVELVRERGWEVGNLDCTVFAEQPKISPYKTQIEQNIAAVIGLALDCVNLKAKTGEGVDSIGRGESMSASAAVLLYRADATPA